MYVVEFVIVAFSLFASAAVVLQPTKKLLCSSVILVCQVYTLVPSIVVAAFGFYQRSLKNVFACFSGLGV